MSNMLIVCGRPFAGKKVYARRVAGEFNEQFKLIEPKRKRGTDKLSVLNFYSKSNKHEMYFAITDVTEVINSEKIPVLYLNHENLNEILTFAEDWDCTVRTIFVDTDIKTSLERFFETKKDEKITEKKAGLLAEEITNFIENEKNTKYDMVYDMVIKAKNVEKAGVKKVPNLFSPSAKFESALLTKRTESKAKSLSSLGLKTVIYNQLKSYGYLTECTKKALIACISNTVETYCCRIDEVI
ncbi:hypothetical protein L1267_11095 [Pseudoalteromonas sp. OFAV1]|uniref:hypothetical protein n=1 Tax=Pseudoalteromonas sp. OFAV1 TaxID=2908892 RepID=UPI001F181B35|nr:hypothetical protein [Pseudoalteromonas sp. OFAV1]MCF2900950.1 hypothetical protein [Pseudoalteromonas sp. OFAV1]